MQRLRKILALSLLLPLLILAGCPSNSSTPLKNGRTALADIAGGLKSGDKAVQTLWNANQQCAPADVPECVITRAEVRQIEGFIKEGTLLNDTLNSCVDLMKDGATAQPAIACANNVVTQFKSKEAQVIIGIKNPNSQATMNAALALVDTGIALLSSSIQQLGGTQ